MFIENKTTIIRHDIMTTLARLVWEGRLFEQINQLPNRIIPREAASFRCCIFKDRELVKQRTIVSLGFSLENEFEIDNHLLSDYARLALERERPTFPILTFLDEACKTCVRANYVVTNVCRNCVARPCVVNCPKNAISNQEHQALINPDRCVNCGICQKVCPYHAIVYVPVPCEEACPVGAISKDERGRELIDYQKCIFCGKCSRACPFGAVMEKSQIVDVLKHLSAGRPVAAMIAPSIVGQFQASLECLAAALRGLGFRHVVEVAIGADRTAAIEAVEFLEQLQKGDPLMGTSCCPAYVEAVKKHARAFTPYVSHAKTPMAYTAELVKQQVPEAIRVFIGPCIAKKHEGLYNPDIDYVLTFEELAALFAAKELDVEQLTADAPLDLGAATAIGRGFPVSHGVADAIVARVKGVVEVKPVLIDGFSRKNVKLLNAYAHKCPGNLVEVMSCEGGCVAGPGVVCEPDKAAKRIKDLTQGNRI